MTRLFYFKVGTISESKREGHKPCTLKRAAQHNLREGPAYATSQFNIDANKSKFNQVLHGPLTSNEIVINSTIYLEKSIAKKTLRKDYVQAGEIIFSPKKLSPNKNSDYFSACRIWAIEMFGSEKILSAVVHRDQPEEHMHVLVSPVVGGQFRGSLLFKKGRLKQLRQSFEQKVLLPLGLPVISPKLNMLQKTALEIQVISALESDGRPSLACSAQAAIRASIRANPLIFIAAMGLEELTTISTI